MNGMRIRLKTILGLAAVGALFVLAAPAERAQAASLSNPAAAAAVQDGSRATTEVRWGHHHHRWHRGHRWHRH